MTDKTSPHWPDFGVLSQGIEIGAGWIHTWQISSGYVSLSISVPELDTKTLRVHPGPPAGQANPDVYVLF